MVSNIESYPFIMEWILWDFLMFESLMFGFNVFVVVVVFVDVCGV
jgi:hypothetical protein